MRLRPAKKILFGAAWRYSAVQRAQAYERVTTWILRQRLRAATEPADERRLQEWLRRKPRKARGKKRGGRRWRANMWRIDHGLDVRW